MFCPRCGTQDDLARGFCRQCGQALVGVRLALEGSSEQSLENLKAGEKWIRGGAASLAVFTIIALAIFVLGIVVDSGSLGYVALINLLLGSLISLPLIVSGRVKVKRAVHLLSGPELERGALEAPTTAKLIEASESVSGAPAPDSVTEHTTLALKEPPRVQQR